MKKKNQINKKLSLKKDTIAALQQINGGRIKGGISRPTLTYICQPQPPDPDPTIVKDSFLSYCDQSCTTTH
jgi:hypothetical protein